MAQRGSPWSQVEVEAAVSDYFDMLKKELRGEAYNKSEHRRQLVQVLEARSEGAVERKHQNISAVLIELGFPWIEGYKPLGNVQQLLRDVVTERLAGASELHALVSREIERQVDVPSVEDLVRLFVDPPKLTSAERGAPQDTSSAVKEPRPPYTPIDYLKREASNQALGAAGERFVLNVEKARLTAGGNERLASRVEHVAVTQGAEPGFDVLSFEGDGRERLIEVKTTGFGREAPFFVTLNELQVSQRERQRYHLYRVFSFRRSPRVFMKRGALDRTCRLEPQTFRGWAG